MHSVAIFVVGFRSSDGQDPKAIKFAKIPFDFALILISTFVSEGDLARFFSQESGVNQPVERISSSDDERETFSFPNFPLESTQISVCQPGSPCSSSLLLFFVQL